MVNKCDICGSITLPESRYCGGCGVDLREPKGLNEELPVIREKVKPEKIKTKGSSKKEDPKDEDVLYWHTIRALCGPEISFPYFFYVIMVLGQGDKKFGFCDCSSCNQGYREMLVAIAHASGNKKVTPHSREIVIKAREAQLDKIKFDLAEMMRREDGKKVNVDTQANQECRPRQQNPGKIIIELDPVVLEDAIFAVLKSERGQEIIQSIPRKRGRPKKKS